MSWRLRVVCEVHQVGSETVRECSIREVYSDGGWSGIASAPVGGSIPELSQSFMDMLKAFAHPVLEVQGDRLVQVTE